jgi:hypothetical protein
MSLVSFANPDWEDITTVSVEGTGLFDNLMYAVKQHLQEEWNAQRIRGADYSKVYLGLVSAVLTNTVQFVTTNALKDLERQKLEEEIALLQLQQTQLQAAIDDFLIRAPLERTKIHEETQLILYQQRQLSEAITDFVIRAPIERAKIEEEIQLIQYQQQQLLEAINDFLIRAPLERTKISQETALIVDQQALTDSQKDLTDKRIVTENLQPTLVTKQTELLDKQIWGFERNAEAGIIKTLADVWSVNRGTDDTFATPEGFNSAKVNNAVSKLFSELGITY